MSSKMKYTVVMLLFLLTSCAHGVKMHKIREGMVEMGLSVPEEKPLKDEAEEVEIDSIRGTLSDGPVIMNAIRDSETGEMVATDVITASKVTARFRNVAERAGYVSISFDLTVPAGLKDSRWQLKIRPLMFIQNDTVSLDPVYVTGKGYRTAQLRGYERYRAFMESIIRDTSDFLRIRQLEIFLERHFPETYAMKNDSSYVSDPLAETLFGVTQKDAFNHYTRHLKWRLNEMRKNRADDMYRKYVKDPIVSEGIRLDTVLTDSSGDFVYRYIHTFRSRPRLKKVIVSLKGSLYERGECIMELPFPDELTFYISSLSALADETPRYRMVILERRVYDNTKALIDFAVGSAEIDTTMGDNASELRRVRKCIDDVVSKEEFELDSLIVMASCSPEGSYRSNLLLSRGRSESVLRYVNEYVPTHWRDSMRTSALPENWDQLELLVKNDTVITDKAREKILEVIGTAGDPDEREKQLTLMPEYVYMREKLYPKLRSVRFDFYLHRVGMQKDTIHTTELDTLYMSGVQALKELDYKKATSILRPYDDYNAALAFMTADYNHSAWDVLERLDDTVPKVCYLKAMVLSRLGRLDEARKYYELCLAYDPYMEYRANLDPEMYDLLKHTEQPF